MATIHWKSAINGAFGTAADWNPNQVPDGNDDVLLDASGSALYTVTSSHDNKVKTLSTASNATLAVTGGTFTIANGTGTGSNKGTILVDDAAILAIGGTFKNVGIIELDSTGSKTELVIDSDTKLTGAGTITLSTGGHNRIVSDGSAHTLTNASNTIAGAGKIGGPHLTLVNQAGGTIDGDSTTAALTLNTGSNDITNAGVIEGTTAKGAVIVSDVSNSGTIEALGANARVRIDGTVTQSSTGIIETSGDGAHIGLASAAIIGGSLQFGSGGVVETVAGSGLSALSSVKITGPGTLEANANTELRILHDSTIGNKVALMSNGDNSHLNIYGKVGALTGTINGGEIEFNAASAANITFAPGTVGTLKLDASTKFTGTISGFAGLAPGSFSQFLAFGDSTIDNGAFKYLPTGNSNLDARIATAVSLGGTGTPVGVGTMNSQLLAMDLGLSATTAYAPGGGTDYAIPGAVDAGVFENGFIGNVNPGTPSEPLLSTEDQMSAYLNSTIGSDPTHTGIEHADPNALYLISSGGNDVTYATKNITDPTAQMNYLAEQAANLTAAIQHLYASGAQHIVVDNDMGDSSLANYYSAQLFADLDASGVPYIKSDVHAMLQDIKTDPTAFGFTADTVKTGSLGVGTASALVELDTDTRINGWGLWGAPTTEADTNIHPELQYAYLNSTDAEKTSLFSDDQHLSAAGQLIQANYDYSLLVSDKAVSQDALDLADIGYAFGTTTATYSGNTTGGTLEVTDGTHTANITLLGNYMAAAFVTASDGNGGTLVVEQTAGAQQAATLIAGPSSHAT